MYIWPDALSALMLLVGDRKVIWYDVKTSASNPVQMAILRTGGTV